MDGATRLALATGAGADNLTTYPARYGASLAIRQSASVKSGLYLVPTLHVTNGDAAADGLTRSSVPGDVLSWKDILHDGAVTGDDDR